MKLLLLVLPFLSTQTLAMSCDTIENKRVTICNDYPNSGNKEQYKKLCLMPNSIGGGKYISAVFNDGDCSKSKVAAKCELKKKGSVTYYYESSDSSKEDMEKGCSFFKGSVFTNYSAKSAPKGASANPSIDVKNNPVIKKYMECAQSARSAEDMNKCKSLLKFN